MSKKFFFTFLSILITSVVFSQKETNNWFFGNYAGVTFNSGNPVAISGGQIFTDEGCSSMSTATGQLLFYTDGITVWDKLHQVMPNGIGLFGDVSSTQSALIVPKPGSSTLFYVFTAGNGFRYSIVDMSLNGGLGDVTAKNVLLYSFTSEKITAIQKSTNEYLIVSRGYNDNSFYTYSLTATGLNTTPVMSYSGMIIPGPTSITPAYTLGYMKISPAGDKIVSIDTMAGIQLFDFDITTGIVSNPLVLGTGYGYYGAEFSPSGRFLYTSKWTDGTIVESSLFQYDLNASNIAGSATTIFYSNVFAISSLQLASNDKIYAVRFETTSLDVINNPEELGLACNFQTDALDLNVVGQPNPIKNRFGLPNFVVSYFSGIKAENFCFGNNTSFSLNNNNNITSAIWDFGDGFTGSGITTNHTYSTPGTYNVSVVITNATGTTTKTKQITISAVPTATQPQDLLQCDNDNNGFFNFDLTSNQSPILNGQNASLYTVKYFANATDYANNIAIATPNNYQNITAYQQQNIIAEVANNSNRDCKTTTTFTIDVFDTSRPASTIATLTSCDNTSFGTSTDGRVRFDLTQRANAILNGQSASQFTVNYFQDAALTMPIATPNNYVNTNPTETIYVKVVNNDNVNCFAATSFMIEVLPLPTIANVLTLKQCDDNIDGFSVFNLTEANSLISTNFANETFSYFETVSDAQNNVNPILNPTTYTNQVVSNDVVFVRVANANGCFRMATLNLNVSTTQIPQNFPQRTFTVCDDAILGTNTDGISSFDFSSVTAQIQAIFPVGQALVITYYRNLADALAENNAITDITNYRNMGYPNTQNIYIRVDSAVNNDCLGLGQHITLNVERIPIVQPQQYKHCDDDQDGNYGFDTTNLQSTLLNGLTNVSVSYFDQSSNPLPSPLPNPFVTATQTITAIVTNNTTTACNYQTTIDFVVDDLPEVFPLNANLTTVCDDEPNPISQDGMYAFDTSSFQSTILGSQTGMIVNYYDQNNNPLTSPLPNPFVTATQNVRVEVISPINATCKAIYTIPFVVNPVPKIDLNGNEIVCNQQTLIKTLDAGILDGTPTTDYTYVWKRNPDPLILGTNATLDINQEGTYTVEVTNTHNCSRTRTITVVASDLAVITNVYVSDLSNNNTIVVSVSGAGDYVFSLDNITFQTSNTFQDVPAGVYNVYVKDLNGCGTTSPYEVNVLGIPSFFTPNGDGYNDYWNIKGLSATINANTQIFIFDRLGKLVKQISPISQGWDGTYLNQNSPATDYWFSIQLREGRIIKGHFALKR